MVSSSIALFKMLLSNLELKFRLFFDNQLINMGDVNVMEYLKMNRNKIGIALSCAAFLCAADVIAENDATVSEVNVNHILVETEAQAHKILGDIKDGKISFEDAAKKSSKCPSGDKVGELGYFGRGAMVKEFEDVAFSTANGEISAPVKTQFGWHIIKVIGKR
jgi:parvulin-like peptidyl-prolyl isomerase